MPNYLNKNMFTHSRELPDLIIRSWTHTTLHNSYNWFDMSDSAPSTIPSWLFTCSPRRGWRGMSRVWWGSPPWCRGRPGAPPQCPRQPSWPRHWASSWSDSFKQWYCHPSQRLIVVLLGKGCWEGIWKSYYNICSLHRLDIYNFFYNNVYHDKTSGHRQKPLLICKAKSRNVKFKMNCVSLSLHGLPWVASEVSE